MRKIILITCALIFLHSLAVFAQTKTYENQRFKYTIEYPETWEQGDASGIVFFRSPKEDPMDHFMENVNVIVEDLALRPMTLKQYNLNFLTVAPGMFRGYSNLDRGPAEIDGRHARYVVYTTRQYNEDLKHKMYFFIIGTRVYKMTYTAQEGEFDKYLPQAETIMRSIKVKERR